MKLKKFDFSGVKSYLFQKGERLGMAICAGIGLLLLGIGAMKAGVSSPPYAEKLKKAWTNMKGQLDVPAPKEVAITFSKDDLPIPWAPNTEEVDNEPWTRIIDDKEVDNKRQNPTVLKVLEDEKHLQVKDLRGGYFAYELEKDKEKVWVFEKAGPAGDDGRASGALRPVKIMKPLRGVIVTGVFPWKEQMEEFQRKLRYEKMADLLAKPEDLPRPLGLNVYRCELAPGAKEYSQWEPIFKWDPKEEKLEVAPRVRDLFREAFIDLDNPEMLGAHVKPGLVTPLPQLANLTYPKLHLQGIQQDESKKSKKTPPSRGKGPGNLFGQQSGGKKGPGGAAQQDVLPVLEPWTKFPTPLQDQFTGKIGFFDPSGANPESPQTNTPMPGGRIPNRDDKIALEDAVVRFIDVNVEPGKTYMYLFAVRMANPNFNKTKDVEFNSLANDKELVSEFTTTPPVTIPGEFFYYATDQKVDATIPGGSNKEAAKADYPVAYGLWNTPVQVHRWLSKFTDGKEWVVADWAIAERLLTRRGDPIGRYSVTTEVPVWDKAKEAFEIGFLPINAKKKNYTGLPIHFIQDTHPPLLVDFEGGWKTNVKIGTAAPIAKDESAVEILILTPEGKLEVRNSRHDTDLDNPVAVERHNRVENWLRVIRNLNSARANNMPGGQ